MLVRPESTPSPFLVVVTCMDARIDTLRALELDHGAAHILRNAGAVVTDDVLRSLVIAQRMIGIQSVAVMGHTDCALSKASAGDAYRALQVETAESPPFAFDVFSDVYEHIRGQTARIRACPWLPYLQDVRGYVLHIEDNRVSPVSAAS